MLNVFLPTVETERLFIRPIRIEDADDLYEIGSDKRVNDWLLYPLYHSIEDSYYSINNIFLIRPGNGIPECYCLVDKKTNKVIGTCDFVNVLEGDTSEIGYQLNYNYWHLGLMSEALNKIIEVGFTYVGLRRIVIRHLVTNSRSENVIKKAGFVFEGYGRKECYDKIKKEFVDVKHYSILKEEWEKRK